MSPSQPRANAASRHLSYVLRHDRASIGLDLQPGGWVRVTDLLKALAEHGKKMRRSDLVALVEADTKGRNTMTHGRIRAAQGHSIEVGLGLDPDLDDPVGPATGTRAILATVVFLRHPRVRPDDSHTSKT